MTLPPKTSTAKRPKRYVRRTIIAVAIISLSGAAIIPAVQAATVPQNAAGAKILLTDTMSRSVNNGWGSSDNKVGYTSNYLPALNVSNGTGQVIIPTPGSSRTIEVTGAKSLDTNATYTFSLAKVPTTGGGVYASMQLRCQGTGCYQVSARVVPGGNVQLELSRVVGGVKSVLGKSATLPLNAKAGSRIKVSFEVKGTTSVALKAKAWNDGSAEPSWQRQETDSSTAKITGAGSARISSYISSGTAATTYSYDNLSVTSWDGVLSSPTPSATATATTTTKPTQTSAPGPTSPSASPTPTATTAPKPTTPTTPPGSNNPGTGNAFGVGAAAIGSASYAIPANALFVSPSGSDSAAGTQSAPLKTLTGAIYKATAGQTIVMRAGNYHESVVVPAGKKITIQNYPKEAVWLDGSQVVKNFMTSGSNFVVDGWKTKFDSSPTYTFGAQDSTTAAWGFVNANYPMAAHPDQVWINNVAQKQAKTLAALAPGSFFVDYAASRLYLGSDPTGKTVLASTLAQAINVRSDSTTIRGIGIQRYAPSVPHMGTVTLEKPNDTIENVVISDNATTGLAISGTDATVTNVSLDRNGMLGATATYADRLKVVGLDSSSNNQEHFNTSPVAGGFKIARSRVVSVTDSNFDSNLGTGLWLDESVYDMTVANNRIQGNAGHGLSVEISAKAKIVNNVITNNSGDGAKLNDSSQLDVWNNTFSGNGRQINIVQDTRRASNQSTPGHDPRQKFPDATMTWITGPVTVRNNVLANGNGAGNCLLCVEDYSHTFSATQMKVSSSGNVFHRKAANSPSWAVVWSTGAGNPAVYTTVSQFSSYTGQDKTSLDILGPTPLDTNFNLSAVVAKQANANATAMPEAIAKVAGEPDGSLYAGSSLP